MAATISRTIQRLDDFTVAQIRAGESIEHPAAVVKEAIENAIDAGATAIRVEIRGGGKREIRISDNGSGIPADQIELAFERHTTSKLREAADLFSVLTLGFRGEALASMASVAQVTCISRTADADVGVEVRLARGKVIARAPHGTPPGTTLIVQNLFGDVPVRLKFLKSDAAEAARITEVVQHAAFSRPQIRWTLISDGREQLQTSGNGDARDVMLALYGPEVARDLMAVSDQDGSGELATRVSGWIGSPERTHGTRKGMHLFVNGRWIQATSVIGQAVEEAYFNRLQSGRHPYVCLSIEVDPGAVDVNIHPSKRDVKFQFSDRVIGLIGRAIRTAFSDSPASVPTTRQALSSAATPPDVDEPETASSPIDAVPETADTRWPVTSIPSHRAPPLPIQATLSIDQMEPERRPVPAPVAPPRVAVRGVSTLVQPSGTERPEPAHQRASPQRSVEPAQKQVRQPSTIREARTGDQSIAPRKQDQQTVPAQQISIPRDLRQEVVAAGDAALPKLQPLGQHEQTWIVASAPGMLYVIDQHRAHERILFERLLREPRDRPLSQHAVVAQEVVLPSPMADLLAEHRRALGAYGFALTAAATGRIVVTAVPEPVDGADLQAVLLELGSFLLAGGRPQSSGWRDHVLATIACHGSIRPGQDLSLPAMEHLLRDLHKCEQPTICAHGEAVASVITTHWLEHQLARTGEEVPGSARKS